MHQLLKNLDETIVIDKAALLKISNNILKEEQVKYVTLNWVMSGLQRRYD